MAYILETSSLVMHFFILWRPFPLVFNKLNVQICPPVKPVWTFFQPTVTWLLFEINVWKVTPLFCDFLDVQWGCLSHHHVLVLLFPYLLSVPPPQVQAALPCAALIHSLLAPTLPQRWSTIPIKSLSIPCWPQGKHKAIDLVGKPQ